jgi:hypothetical protein
MTSKWHETKDLPHLDYSLDRQYMVPRTQTFELGSVAVEPVRSPYPNVVKNTQALKLKQERLDYIAKEMRKLGSIRPGGRK